MAISAAASRAPPDRRAMVGAAEGSWRTRARRPREAMVIGVDWWARGESTGELTIGRHRSRAPSSANTRRGATVQAKERDVALPKPIQECGSRRHRGVTCRRTAPPDAALVRVGTTLARDRYGRRATPAALRQPRYASRATPAALRQPRYARADHS